MLCSELPELLEFDLAVFSCEPRNKWKVEKSSYMLNTWYTCSFNSFRSKNIQMHSQYF